MRITPVGLQILEAFQNLQDVKSIAAKLNLSSRQIWDNYIKKHRKFGYIEKISGGVYKLSSKGENVLKFYKALPEIEKEIIILAKSKTKNNIIIKIIKNKFNLDFSHSAIYSKINRLRKTENINPRNNKNCCLV